jgi:hypothetical protein
MKDLYDYSGQGRRQKTLHTTPLKRMSWVVDTAGAKQQIKPQADVLH